MILLSRFADGQLNSLVAHFEAKDRPEAVRNLIAAVARAAERIANDRGNFFDAPRPYPGLTRPGWRWLKERSYWIAFAADGPDTEIRAIFHEAANIPARLP